MGTHFTYIYTSKLAIDAPASCIADIVRQSKRNNLQRGITGLLIFDGENFCQHLEGKERSIRILIETIKKDNRHTNFEVLHEGYTHKPRLFEDWSIAYSTIDNIALDTYFNDAIATGVQARQTLEDLLPSLDLQPV